MGTGGKMTHSQILYRESKLRSSIQFILLGETVTPRKTVWKSFRSYRGWRTSRKHGPLKKLSRAFMGSQRLKHQSRNLQGSRQGMYVLTIILKILWGFCQWKQVFLSLFWLLSCPASIWGLLIWLIVSCLALFDSTLFLLFSKEIGNVGICGRGKWECIMGCRGRGCFVWVKNLFSINFLKG